MGAIVKQSSKRKWLLLYWLAISFVWLWWGFQLLLSSLDGVRDPYPRTTFLIALLLSSVIVAYRWAVESMAAFGSDIEQLLIASSGPNGTKSKQWYASEFDEIFTWTKSAGLTVFFTILALVIARKIQVASW